MRRLHKNFCYDYFTSTPARRKLYMIFLRFRHLIVAPSHGSIIFVVQIPSEQYYHVLNIFVHVFRFQVLLVISGVFLTCEPTGAEDDLSMTYRVSAERIVQVRISKINPKAMIPKYNNDSTYVLRSLSIYNIPFFSTQTVKYLGLNIGRGR